MWLLRISDVIQVQIGYGMARRIDVATHMVLTPAPREAPEKRVPEKGVAPPKKVSSSEKNEFPVSPREKVSRKSEFPIGSRRKGLVPKEGP